MTNVTLDNEAQVCYNGGMTAKKPDCQCLCGEQTGGGKFRPGHDARHKGALIRKALEDHAASIAELETRGWTSHLEKAKNRGKSRVQMVTGAGGEVVTVDGLPKNATRIGDVPTPDETIAGVLDQSAHQRQRLVSE